jgi:4-hydroxythreonine-4-phosphate dehydrogenase
MKLRLAVTIGDPAGIGPEVVLKALAKPEPHRRAQILLVGSTAVLRHMAERLSLDMDFPLFKAGARWGSAPARIPVRQVGSLKPADIVFGRIAADAGRDSVAYVQEAAELAKAELVDAIVTAPINKESIRAAGVAFPGHTEILSAALERAGETMFVVDKLRIFFLTRHLSLQRAIAAIDRGPLLHLLEHAREFLQEIGLTDPVIGVAGLNPHAGVGGLFGDEEIRVLQPAIQEARQRGWDVHGPVGADSIFHQALQGRYDAVISLYHDQGHIAAKTYDFNRTVSVTTGLPVLRTSVDHGTAFDIAGQGIADPTNMIEALRVAVDMTEAKLRREGASVPGR